MRDIPAKGIHMKRNGSAKPISLFWWKRDCGTKRNFGDDMSPILLEYATRRPVRYAEASKCDVIGVGSILQLIAGRKKARRILRSRVFSLRRLKPEVWGSGTTGMSADGTAELTDMVAWHLDIRALRGPATEQKLGVRASVHGDPALLASAIWPHRSGKTSRLGIVPHYTDKDSPKLARLREQLPDAKVISVENEVSQVVREISCCEVILSSSLHGLIVADSFGIPNHRLVLEGQLTGGDFKFLDYANGIGRPDISPLDLDIPTRWGEGDFDYQKGLPKVMDRLVNSISDLAS